MDRNGGFSLIELIVVVAMIAVLTGLLVPNIFAKYTTEARACARRMDSMLSECRVKQMSRLDPYTVTFYMRDGGGLYGKFSDERDEKLGGAAMQLVDQDGKPLKSVTFAFKRATGEVASVVSDPPDSVTKNGGEYRFGVTARGKDFMINVTALTGRHGVAP